MYRRHRVAVVMPIHNEESHIARAVSRVPSFVDLIIAIDDGSRDRTWERLSQIENERLIRLRHKKNRGVGAATKTGYARALEAGVDLIAVMDGDGQMDGRDLSALLDRAISGVDYVKGNRFLHRGSISAMPVSRFIGNHVFSWLTGKAARIMINLDAQACARGGKQHLVWKPVSVVKIADPQGGERRAPNHSIAALRIEIDHYARSFSCEPAKNVIADEARNRHR